ncbi:hypothetical protein GGQ84_000236 [Desulfitispora alkaliphila]|uniref:hypothetical protein n=1 Tax=Desulfitispora alkaliphila TaxID=622674 RepID=UPI003D1C0A44
MDAKKGIGEERLPDTDRPSGYCPRCEKQSSFEIEGSLPVTFDYDKFIRVGDGTVYYNKVERVSSLVCRNCKQGVVVVEEQCNKDEIDHRSTPEQERPYKGIYWWPLPNAQLTADVPESIASVFAEAAIAYDAKCYRAAVVMALRTVEAVTVDMGEREGSGISRMESLNNKGLLHNSLYQWSCEVVLLKHHVDKFDPMVKVNAEDVRQLILFIKQLLKYLYQLPADFERLRKN